MMKNSYDLTFVVPIYNTAFCLASCLDSLISQPCNKEIICINDGSTDESMAILESYFENYPFITIIHQHNQGQSAARNRGIEQARGRYIYFVDSDDVFIAQNLSTMLELADMYCIDYLKGNMLLHSLSSGKTEIKPPSHPNTRGDQATLLTGNEMLSYFQRSGWMPSPCLGFYRTKILHQYNIRFLEGVKNEDALFWVDFCLASPNIRVLETDYIFINIIYE